MRLAAGHARHQVAPDGVVEGRGRHRAVEPPANEEVAQVGVGLQQHLGREQHVVDADDAVGVQLDVVEERRAAVQGEVQRVVQVVVQIGAGADHEVDQAPLHQLDDAPPQPGRRQRPGHGQADGGVVGRIEHLVGVHVASLAKAAGIERLEPLVDESLQSGPAAGTVVTDRFAGEMPAGRRGCGGR